MKANTVHILLVDDQKVDVLAVKRLFRELKIASATQSFLEAIRMLEHYWRVSEFPV